MGHDDKNGERSFAICKDHHDADWNQPELENESCVLCRLFYLEAQEQLLEEWQQRAKRAEATIEEIQRPLDAQMARLNATVARLNGENERLKSAASSARSQEGYRTISTGYQDVFNAIAAAVKIEAGNAIGISVEKFLANIPTVPVTPNSATSPSNSDAKDAARYRWLRDISVPPHNFYLSVPDEFKDERYRPQQVDAAIDAAIGARSEGTGP